MKKFINAQIAAIDRGLINTFVLGFSFCIIFCAYGPTQSFLTNLRPEVGYLALAIGYISFAVCNFVAPAIEVKLGPRPTLIIGACLYILFIGSNISDVPEFTFAAAVCVGLGAAILWTAQGDFLTRCANSSPSKANMGIYSGIFFALYMVHLAVGNVIGASIITQGYSDTYLFFVLTMIAIAGTVCLFALRHMEKTAPSSNPPKNENKNENENSKNENETVLPIEITIEENDREEEQCGTSTQNENENENEILDKIKNENEKNSENSENEKLEQKTENENENNKNENEKKRHVLLATFDALKSWQMALCIVSFFHSGFSAAYVFGKFPGILPTDQVGYIMSVLGAAEFVGSLVSGQIDRKLNRLVLIIHIYVFQLLAIVLNLLYIFQPDLFGDKTAVMYVIGVIFGFGDPNTVMYSVLGAAFEGNPSGFSAYRLVQSVATSIGFFVGQKMRPEEFLIAMICLLTIGYFNIGVFEVMRRRKQTKK